jgi:hypothetical protein
MLVVVLPLEHLAVLKPMLLNLQFTIIIDGVVMTKDEVLAKLYSIQNELSMIYDYANEARDSELMDQINNAEVSIEEALDGLYFFENDGQPDEAQEWHDFDPDC